MTPSSAHQHTLTELKRVEVFTVNELSLSALMSVDEPNEDDYRSSQSVVRSFLHSVYLCVE